MLISTRIYASTKYYCERYQVINENENEDEQAICFEIPVFIKWKMICKQLNKSTVTATNRKINIERMNLGKIVKNLS
jgi:hypothetical protein